MYDHLAPPTTGTFNTFPPSVTAGGGVGNTTYITTEPQAPRAPVAIAISTLHDRIEQLHQAIAELANRLEPVCRPTAPTPGNAVGGRQIAAHSSVGGMIDASCERLDQARQRIVELLDRCEL